MSNTPSDAELESLISQNLLVDSEGQCAFESLVDIRPELVKFARAVLAKWGAPQPVVREPLTPEQMDAALGSAKKVKPGYVGWVTDQRREWGRAVERAHGITKGGQHGAE